MHVHLIYSGHPNPGAWFRHAADFEQVTIPASARQMLMAGVTSVRDLAAPADAMLAVKRRIADGTLPGPTLYAAGPALAKLAPDQTTVTSQFLPVTDAADARAKTPMPPDTAVQRFKFTAAAWRDGGALSGLILSANERLRAEAGGPQGDALLRQSYESLRACLPDEPAATLPERQVPEEKPARHTATRVER